MDPDTQIQVPAAVISGHGTDLLSTYWPAAIVGMTAVLVMALLVRSLRRPQRRGARRCVCGFAAGFTVSAALVVVALALGVNAWVGYFPSVSALQRWVSSTTHLAEMNPDLVSPDIAGEADPTETGESFETEITATAAHIPDQAAWVYVPPGYDSPGNTQRYPVIYALHGAPGSAVDWFSGGQIDATLDGLIAAKSIPEAIVVAPNVSGGGDRMYDEPLNLPDGPQFETYVSSDVVRWADQHLRTQPDPAHRIIAGMSAGALGALIDGLHHPEVFGGVVSLMPYLHPYAEAVTKNAAAVQHNSPLDVIAEVSALQRAPNTELSVPRVFLGQGDGEPTDEATEIRDALRTAGSTTTLRVLPGLEHNWTAAKTIMPYGLIWAFEQLGWVPPASPG